MDKKRFMVVSGFLRSRKDNNDGRRLQSTLTAQANMQQSLQMTWEQIILSMQSILTVRM